MRYLDPTNDLAFRKIFGDEQHQDSLISLINAVLEFTGDQRVVSVTIANPYQVPKLESLKETIIDVRARDAAKREFIVEMQCEGNANWAKRALYATSKAYASQLGKGEEYHLLQPVYFIGILKFAMPWDKIFPGEQAEREEKKHQPKRPWLPHFVLKEAMTNLQMTKDFSLHFMELASFDKALEDCRDIVEKWAWFFKNATQVDEVPPVMNEPGFLQAFQTAERMRWSYEELHSYENMMQYRAMAQRNMEEKLAEMKQIGMAEGLAEGMAEGLAKGLAKGKLKSQQEAAKRLQALPMSMETIAEVLQVTLEELREWLA